MMTLNTSQKMLGHTHSQPFHIHKQPKITEIDPKKIISIVNFKS